VSVAKYGFANLTHRLNGTGSPVGNFSLKSAVSRENGSKVLIGCNTLDLHAQRGHVKLAKALHKQGMSVCWSGIISKGDDGFSLLRFEVQREPKPQEHIMSDVGNLCKRIR
jgi:hypothetical protein